MKKSILKLLILLNNLTFSQEKLADFNHSSTVSNVDYIKSFSIFNINNNNTATFLIEGKNICGYLQNEKNNSLKKLELKNISSIYNSLLGCFFDINDNYNFILTNKNKNKFFIVKFSFNLKKVFVEEDFLKNKSLVFIQSVNKKDSCYLFFINKKTSNITSLKYAINEKKLTKIYNFKDINFLINDKKSTSLNKLITDFTKPNIERIKNSEYELTKINESQLDDKALKKSLTNDSNQKKYSAPNSIELVSRLSKLYVRDKHVIISLDKNRFFTQILTLNLNDDNYSFKRIKKPLFKEKNMYKRSNSFIFDDKIALVSASKKEIICSIHNLTNNKKIKEFSTDFNSTINFKNSAIIQEGGAFKEHRIFEETNKFLRKISQSNLGIGISKKIDGYEMIIGSEKLAEKGKTTISNIVGLGLSVPGLFNLGPFLSVDNFSFSSYLTTKSVRIHCLLDEHFNHKKGEINKNIYDEIISFIKPSDENYIDDIYKSEVDKLKTPTAINVFRKNDTLVLGYYLPKKQKYFFYKF